MHKVNLANESVVTFDYEMVITEETCSFNGETDHLCWLNRGVKWPTSCGRYYLWFRKSNNN